MTKPSSLTVSGRPPEPGTKARRETARRNTRERGSLSTAPVPSPAAASPFGLLRPEEAAEWLKVSRRTLASLDIRRVKIGKSVRYDPIDLQQFADQHGDRRRVTETA